MRVKADSDILRQQLIFRKLFIRVFAVDGSGIAPFGAAVFLPWAGIALGGKIYPDSHAIGDDKKEDSFYAVLTPLYMKRII